MNETCLFVFPVTGDRKGVGGQRRLGLGVLKVDNGSVFFYHVDLLYSRNGIDTELLQRRLEFFVVGSRGRMHNLLLAPWGTLATDSHLLL